MRAASATRTMKRELVEISGPGDPPTEHNRARDVVDPERPAGQPIFVSENQEAKHVEAERGEGEVMVLHAQRGKA